MRLSFIASTIDNRGQKGFDSGKLVSSIKRHTGVDTQGLPHMLLVTTGNVPDRVGALEEFTIHQETLSEVEQVVVDGGYTGEPFTTAAGDIFCATVEVANCNELCTFKVIL